MTSKTPCSAMIGLVASAACDNVSGQTATNRESVALNAVVAAGGSGGAVGGMGAGSNHELHNGFTSIISNYVSNAFSLATPVINEATNQINDSSIATSVQDRAANAVNGSMPGGKQ